MNFTILQRPTRLFGRLEWGLAVGALIVGCGPHEQKSVVSLVAAHGTVTLDGKPLPGAILEFIPEGDTRGQGGGGRTAADGTFSATTPYGEPGVAAGTYRVVVHKYELPPGAAAAEPSDPSLAPADVPQKELLPPMYSDPAHTKLTTNVTPAGNTSINLELKSVR